MLEDIDDCGYGDDEDSVFIPRITYCHDKRGNDRVK